MQHFKGRRITSNLARLTCLYVDLDFYREPRWQGSKASDVAAEVIAHLNAAKLPLPTYILASGRGLQVVWLHQPVPAKVLPRWQAVQSRLVATLSGFGADRAACDPCRVFRVTGTLNAKSQTMASMVHLDPERRSGERRSFEIFAKACLPHTIRDRRLRRGLPGHTACNCPVKAATAKRPYTGRSYHETKIADLSRLRRLRGWDVLPAGQRDLWLFHFATSIVWLYSPDIAWQMILEAASTMAAWSEAETTARLSTVLCKARYDADSQNDGAQGRSTFKRYRISAARCVKDLKIKSGEMRGAGLRVLVDDAIRCERRAERQKTTRRSRGSVTRPTYLSRAKERNNAAWRAKQTGASWQAVADSLQFPSAGAARKAASRAKENLHSPKGTGLNQCMGGVATSPAAAQADPVEMMAPMASQPARRVRSGRFGGGDAERRASRRSGCAAALSAPGGLEDQHERPGCLQSPMAVHTAAKPVRIKRSSKLAKRGSTDGGGVDLAFAAMNQDWVGGGDVGPVCQAFGVLHRALSSRPEPTVANNLTAACRGEALPGGCHPTLASAHVVEFG
jgi:hypothetical protein